VGVAIFDGGAFLVGVLARVVGVVDRVVGVLALATGGTPCCREVRPLVGAYLAAVGELERVEAGLGRVGGAFLILMAVTETGRREVGEMGDVGDVGFEGS
jgi:hypothetical protein